MVCRSAWVSSRLRTASPALPFPLAAMRTPSRYKVGRAVRNDNPRRGHAMPGQTMLALQEILGARDRIRGQIEVTPCPRADVFSEMVGAQLYFKLENLQRTGSFKERGASNKLQQLTAGERARGVVAASAGNHAQGVAFNAQKLGIKSTIVMP